MRKLILAVIIAIILGVYGGKPAQADPCDTSANLIGNCGFESGSLTSWTGIPVSETDNWFGVSRFDALTGSYGAYLGAFGSYNAGSNSSGLLYQAPTLIPETVYTLTFDLAHDTSSNPTAIPDNYFDVRVNGVAIPSLEVIDAGNQAVTAYGYSFIATSSSTPISFLAQDANFYFSLDNVSLVAAPEPASFLLIASVIGGLLFRARRRTTA